MKKNRFFLALFLFVSSFFCAERLSAGAVDSGLYKGSEQISSLRPIISSIANGAMRLPVVRRPQHYLFYTIGLIGCACVVYCAYKFGWFEKIKRMFFPSKKISLPDTKNPDTKKDESLPLNVPKQEQKSDEDFYKKYPLKLECDHSFDVVNEKPLITKNEQVINGRSDSDISNIKFALPQFGSIEIQCKQNRSSEDVSVVTHFSYDNEDIVVCGVFDGNGNKQDPEVSRLLAANLPRRIVSGLLPLKEINDNAVMKQLVPIFEQMDKDLLNEKIVKKVPVEGSKCAAEYSGSTACVLVFLPKRNKAIMINLGDSMASALLSNDAVETTCIHSFLTSKSENLRFKDTYGAWNLSLVNIKANLGGIGLLVGKKTCALTRAFGYRNQYGMKINQRMLVEPWVQVFDFKNVNSILFGCDGFWEQVLDRDNDSSGDLINTKKKSIDNFVKGKLKDKLLNLDNCINDAAQKTNDDITVGVIKLSPQ